MRRRMVVCELEAVGGGVELTCTACGLLVELSADTGTERVRGLRELRSECPRASLHLYMARKVDRGPQVAED